MRHWLLTNTFYGNWLPGDARGSVTSVRESANAAAPRVEHDIPGTPWEPELPKLRAAAEHAMKGPPIRFNRAKAECLLDQFQETANYRGWKLLAVAIMYNHIHLVVRVPNDPSPQKVLADFKAYGTRALTAHFGRPESNTWWTSGGSKRKLADEAAIAAAVEYVLHRQPNPLVAWSAELGRLV